ncbi:MAG: menaquinone biosynthesis decarboxylase [Bacteroidales bacterium]|nr:menaquinone biosynthesis decarboxylase [Bacteroidales bacterium]
MNDFIQLLKQHNEIIEISARVNTELEITEITDRISKSTIYNKALLFRNNGSSFPILINAFGSEKRIALALHSNSLKQVEQNIVELLSILKPPQTFSEKIKLAGQALKFSSYFPKYKNKKGVCQQVIHRNPDIHILPVLKCWPHDGGKFITLPLVHTKPDNSNELNVGMYRMQVFTHNSTGMHWHIHKTGAVHYQQAKETNKQIPIAVCLGGDPVYTYCATAPLPHGINEYILAGILRKKAVTLVPCITQPIVVPEDADIVIEGFIDPNEPLHTEGPFGDHTGFYSLPELYPKFHITAITHKKNAIYPATIVGIPPQEDYWFIKASERIFLQFLKHSLLHEVIDISMPPYGVAHNLVLVQIKSQYPRHANKIAHALWGIGQMMLNKILIITQQKLDHTVFHNIATIRWKNKILLSYGPMDASEHAGLKPLEGGKLMFDATSITEKILFTSNTMQYIPVLEQFFHTNKIRTFDQAYNIFIVFANHKQQYHYQTLTQQIANFAVLDEIRIFILQQELYSLEISDWAWHFLANFDPSTDMHIVSHQQTDILIFDGRIKPNKAKKIPNPTINRTDIIELVNKRWTEYFNLPFIASPSEKYKQLFFGDTYFISD